MPDKLFFRMASIRYKQKTHLRVLDFTLQFRVSICLRTQYDRYWVQDLSHFRKIFSKSTNVQSAKLKTVIEIRGGSSQGALGARAPPLVSEYMFIVLNV